MKIISKIVNAVLLVILLIVFAAVAWNLTMKIVFKQSYPSFFGYSHAIVLTGSMEPTIKAGDLIIFKKQAEYSVGDIITFGLRGTCVTHRIIDKTESGFITQGDANNTPDLSTVPSDEILGEVQYVIPNGGNAILKLRSPIGLFVIIMGILVLTLFTNALSRDEFSCFD